MSKGLDEVLGPADAELAVRIEADLADHVAELNERRRNLLTLRGLGITSVSALLTATVVSSEWVLALFAALVICAVVYVDLEANRRIDAIERRLPFLEEIGLGIRRCLARGDKDQRLLQSVRADLRTYKRTPPGRDEVAWIKIKLRWPLARCKLQRPYTRSAGGLRVRHALGGFEWLYLLLTAGCLALGISAALSRNNVMEVVGCAVTQGRDLRAAAENGRCGASVGSRASSAGKESQTCHVPRTLRRSTLVFRCSGVHGVVAINIMHGRDLVTSQALPVRLNGEVALRAPRLQRGQTYQVTIENAAGLLAAHHNLTVAESVRRYHSG